MFHQIHRKCMNSRLNKLYLHPNHRNMCRRLRSQNGRHLSVDVLLRMHCLVHLSVINDQLLLWMLSPVNLVRLNLSWKPKVVYCFAVDFGLGLTHCLLIQSIRLLIDNYKSHQLIHTWILIIRCYWIDLLLLWMMLLLLWWWLLHLFIFVSGAVKRLKLQRRLSNLKFYLISTKQSSPH